MPTEMENLAAAVKAKAAEFIVDPAKGHAAGYFPDYGGFRRSPDEIGHPGHAHRARADSTAWLYSVAKRDLVEWQWRVDVGVRGDEIENDLVVLGRRY